ncbi:MAG: hypothetical protein ACKO34_08830 [Vampirovibrionales bacterium]
MPSLFLRNHDNSRWALWGILSYLLLFTATLAWADSLPRPRQALTQPQHTQGWVDIYLTDDRICQGCKMTDLGNERVWLENTAGLGEAVWSHEVVGLDTHPWQRKFLKHSLRSEHVLVTKTLWPNASSAKVGLINAGNDSSQASPDF